MRTWLGTTNNLVDGILEQLQELFDAVAQNTKVPFSAPATHAVQTVSQFYTSTYHISLICATSCCGSAPRLLPTRSNMTSPKRGADSACIPCSTRLGRKTRPKLHGQSHGVKVKQDPSNACQETDPMRIGKTRLRSCTRSLQ
jgi:hypothetical protein